MICNGDCGVTWRSFRFYRAYYWLKREKSDHRDLSTQHISYDDITHFFNYHHPSTHQVAAAIKLSLTVPDQFCKSSITTIDKTHVFEVKCEFYSVDKLFRNLYREKSRDGLARKMANAGRETEMRIGRTERSCS